MTLVRLALAALAALLLTARSQAADLPVLTVYTYSSFVADWGPGPAVKKAFEASCGCRVDYVAPGDSSRAAQDTANTRPFGSVVRVGVRLIVRWR